MSEFFTPYEGTNPYLFISYSHRDTEKVVETIRGIHQLYYRLWYDEGIPPGDDWPGNIAVHMDNCEMVLFFLSRTALDSPNCKSEISTAAELRKKILLLKLEDIPEDQYPEGWESLKDAAVIPPADTPEERAKHILNSGYLTERFHGTKEEFNKQNETNDKNSILGTIAMIIAGALLFLSLSGVAALSLGIIQLNVTPTPIPTETSGPTDTPSPKPEPTDTPEPTEIPTHTPEPTANITLGEGMLNRKVDFPDEQEKDAIQWILQTNELLADDEEITYRHLQQIEEIYFVGTKDRLLTLDNVEIAEDGTVTSFSTPLKNGSVSSLELISKMPYLKKLALIKQPISDVSGLSGMTKLQEVNLACSEVDSVEGLSNMPSLYLLNLAHTAVGEIVPKVRLT